MGVKVDYDSYHFLTNYGLPVREQVAYFGADLPFLSTLILVCRTPH